jgi:hypothetical protein
VRFELRAYTSSHSTSPFLGWVFSRYGLLNYLPGLALKIDPSCLCLLRSYDYRHEPPVPSRIKILRKRYQLITICEPYGGGEFNYIMRTFVNVTMYPQYNNNKINF